MLRSGELGRLSERDLRVDGTLGKVVITCFTTGCDAGGRRLRSRGYIQLSRLAQEDFTPSC